MTVTERSSNIVCMGFPGGSVGKESACNAEDQVGSLGGEDPLEKGMAPVFCLGNPMDRGTWQATVHVVARSQT